MYRATLSFTTKNYDVRKNQILADDFTTQDEIIEFLNIGYIVVYDDTLEITQNGLYDVEDYQKADVDVAGGQATLQEKTVTITQNGETTITADTGYDGLSEVGLNVSVPAPQPNLQDKSVTVTQNGETTITADTGYDGLNEVGLNVNVPAPQPSLQDKQVSVTSNTTTTIQADSQYDGLGTVEVTTNVTPNLQNKQVSITTNTTTNIQADSQYDGLGNVEVTTNIQPNLQNKSATITENTTTTIQADSGYDGLGTVEVTTNVSGGADLNDYFINSVQPGSSSMSGFAEYSIKKIPENLVIGQTYMNGLFTNLKAITSIPYFDTTGITGFRYFCSGCSELVNVPIYNTASVLGPYGMSNMFSSCPKLSDESLNNILKMCINATTYTGTKTLTNVGLDATQRTKCQSLSNWNDFVNAGWSA